MYFRIGASRRVSVEWCLGSVGIEAQNRSHQAGDHENLQRGKGEAPERQMKLPMFLEEGSQDLRSRHFQQILGGLQLVFQSEIQSLLHDLVTRAHLRKPGRFNRKLLSFRQRENCARSVPSLCWGIAGV